MLNAGTILQNRYHIIRQLGVGGFGAVYLASDARLGNRFVVVKENQGGDPTQFQTEANILANLNHLNLPRVFDHFTEPTGAQYLVMDYIEGQDLGTILQNGALSEPDALVWIRQILNAVEYLHGNRIIHRDIKPQNIIITPGRKAILVDFGIAKRMVTGRPTTTGARAVTAGFSAPEQYAGGTSECSDIYSLCATLYALLTAHEPPEAPMIASGRMQLMPPRSLNPRISPQTEQAILRGMQIQAQYRFQSIGELRNALAGMISTTLPVPKAPPYVPPTQTAPATKPTAPVVLSAMVGGLLMLLVCGIGSVIAYGFIQAGARTPTPTMIVIATTPRPGVTASAPVTNAPPTPDLQQTRLVSDQRTQTAVSAQRTADAVAAQQTALSGQRTMDAVAAQQTAVSAQQTQVAINAQQTQVSARLTTEAISAQQTIEAQRQILSAQLTAEAVKAQQTLVALWATQTAAAQPAVRYVRWVNQHSQKCLTVENGGPHIIQTTCSGGDDQLWLAPSGQFPLQSKSGVCVYFTTDHAELLQTGNCASSPRWYVGASSGGYSQIVTGGNLCLDVDSRRTDNGAWILWYPCYVPLRSDSGNQLWAPQ